MEKAWRDFTIFLKKKRYLVRGYDQNAINPRYRDELGGETDFKAFRSVWFFVETGIDINKDSLKNLFDVLRSVQTDSNRSYKTNLHLCFWAESDKNYFWRKNVMLLYNTDPFSLASFLDEQLVAARNHSQNICAENGSVYFKASINQISYQDLVIFAAEVPLPTLKSWLNPIAGPKILSNIVCVCATQQILGITFAKKLGGSEDVFLIETKKEKPISQIATALTTANRERGEETIDLQNHNLQKKGSGSMIINRYLKPDTLERMKSDLAFLLKSVKDSKGELDIALREEYINLYYQGNSLAKIDFLPDNKYKVSMNEKFVKGSGIDTDSRFAENMSSNTNYRYFKISKDDLNPLLQKKYIDNLCSKIREVNNGDEITFEQMLITDNLDRQDLIIIDRQVTDTKLKRKRMDLLALIQGENELPGQYKFCVIEVKTGKNSELKGAVVTQLDNYVKHIEQHFVDYKDCYECHYAQKAQLGLIGNAKFIKPIEILNDVKGMVVVGRYSGLAQNVLTQLQNSNKDLKVQQVKYTLDNPF